MENFKLTDEKKSELKQNGFVILQIESIEREMLLRIANQLGKPIQTFKTDGEGITIIKPNEEIDKSLQGFSFKKLPLHNDGVTFDGVPPKYTLTAFANNEVEGGQSIFLDSKVILAQLHEEQIETLLNTPYWETWSVEKQKKIPYKEQTVLFKNTDGTMGIRYRQEIISLQDESKHSQEFKEALKAFQNAISNSEITHFDSKAGDLIIYDNQRMLHGRTSISKTQKGVQREVWRILVQ